MIKEKKLHFIHLPKTGGTSLYSFLEKQFKFDEVCPFIHLHNAPDWVPREQVLNNACKEKLLGYKFYRGHLGWIPRTIFADDEIESIVFLRNPVARTLSFYNYVKGHLNHFDNRFNYWQTFDDFVFDKKMGLTLHSNEQTNYFCSEHFFQKSFSVALPDKYMKGFGLWGLTGWVEIDLTPKQMLQLAIERLHKCSFVGLTEHFGESFEQLCMQFKFCHPKEVPKKNVSLKQTKKSELNSKILDLVMEYNNLDLILYQEAIKIFEDRKKVRIHFDRDELQKEITNKIPPCDEIKFTFADKFIGDGWDAREGVPPNLFVWASSTLSSLVFVIKKHSDLFISFRVIHTMLSELHQKLNLTANSFPIILTQHYHPDGGLVFEGIIPQNVLCNENLLELIFSIPEVIRPIDICKENIDFRKLGFAFNELNIKPIECAILESHKELFESLSQSKKYAEEINILQKSLQEKNKSLQQIVHSRSWRFTAPMRSLTHRLQKIKNWILENSFFKNRAISSDG